MPRDSTATRSRILAAAVTEFAAHGLAGGRVDRIAQAAEVNIRSVYVHFESKEKLFDAAVYEALHEIGEAVPFTETDLPAYAGHLFDAVSQRPAAHRLNLWRLLEAPGAGPDDRTLYARKLQNALTVGPPTSVPYADLFILVPAMVAAWLIASRDMIAADGSDPADEERRLRFRGSLVEAVRLLAPGA